ncbi:hypothetical protein G6F24_017860 [Rhizopus arrhizus]|nr:hypothetical protein G6F24_017860 [Rhizopus arrhizus]
MRRADITWTAQTLDAFLQSPTHLVPGTRMYNAFPSAERRALPGHERRDRSEQRRRIGFGCVLQALDQRIGLACQHARPHRPEAAGLAMQV